MRRPFKIGVSFGLTTGIITTLGLMAGLNTSTQSKSIVIGGILIIAIADSLSEAMGVHIALETERRISHKEIWESTFCTIISKFMFSAVFIIPVILFNLQTAIIFSILGGLYMIFLISLCIAREREENVYTVVTEHILITIIVIILSHYAGLAIHNIFG